MVTVALIVTGDMEHEGLAGSLQRVFPDVSFSVQKVDGFTSAKVIWPPPRASVPSNIEKFATAFLAALDPGRRKTKPDFVFGIDDLELENLGRPHAVIEAFRAAVALELTRRQGMMPAGRFDRFVERVKENCSFHLFVPMPEAYFFSDPGALLATGCARQPVLASDGDVEQFSTTDPDYLADPDSHPLHPKRYLDFLLRPEFYRETDQGLKALSVLDWQRVMVRSRQTLFLRSLFQDLAFAAGDDLSRFPGDLHPLTADHRNPKRLLRNF